LAQPALRTQDIKDKVETLSKRNPAYASLCGFVGGLLLLAQEGEPGKAPSLEPGAAQGLVKGKPLWDLEALELDWPVAWELLAKLADSLDDKPGGPETARAVARVRQEAGNGPGLFRAALSDDGEALQKASRDLNVDHGVLRMLLRLALRPGLLAAAEAARRESGLDSWSFGHCPVCGSAPALAELAGEGGQRRLHCGLCETTWAYPRLSCPFCENDDHKQIILLKAEEEEGLFVQCCRHCGLYLKTIDLRQIAGPIIVPLDDAATWHLDLIAREQTPGASTH
jgi:FdhE protein